MVVQCYLLLMKCREAGTDFHTWRKFAEWIGGYHYVLPANRTLNKEFALKLLSRELDAKSRAPLTVAYYLLLDAQTLLTDADQALVLERLNSERI